MREVDIESLREISFRYHLKMDDEELKAFQQVINRGVIKSYECIDKMIEPELPVKYRRTPGYRPSPGKNNLNAWFWKTEVQHSETGKLMGKRIALKDNISLAGVPMMNGTRVLEGFVPQIDATIVTRILDEGGEILGKAVCESLCMAGSSFTSDTGPVLNPHNRAYSAGGSSSGCAALIASGEIDMAIGCDQGGSIRIPSAWCGIYGLKPTWGLVPYTGIFPIELTIDHVGPMARTVKDIAILLEAIAGPDGMDPRQYGITAKPYTEHLTGEAKGLRIGLLKEGFEWDDISEKIVDQTVQAAAKSLKQCGATVDAISIPMHRDGLNVWKVISNEGATLQMIRGNSHGANWKGYYQTQLIDVFSSGLLQRSNDLSLTTQFSLLVGEYMQDAYHGHYYSKAQNLARKLKKAYDEKFADYDIIIMPTIPFQATKLPEGRPNPHDCTDLGNYIARATEMMPNTAVFNITGHPAMNVPCGLKNGLPIGMMLVGAYGQEEKILRAAHAFETMTHGIYSRAVSG